jgi:ATP-dependent DNA helicase RecG
MKGSEKSSEKSSEKILALLKNNPKLTIAEIAIHTSISSRSVEKHLAKLKKQERIVRYGPAKGGYWKVIG